MHELLPPASKIRITQQVGGVLSKNLDSVDQLILVMPKRPKAAVWKAIPQGSRLQAAVAKRRSGDVPALQTRLNNNRQTLVVGAMVSNDTSSFETLTISRKLVSAATTEKAGNLGVLVVGFDLETEQSLHKAVVAAALAAEVCPASYSTMA